MRTAVLVIDLQPGVVEGCFDVAGVVARTVALVGRARAQGVPVLWVQHEEPEMPHGSAAWQLLPELAPAPSEPRIYKTCFDAFAGTPLRATLDGLGIARLVLAGAQSDYCIRSTAQRAAIEGYAVVLAGDAHTAADADCAGRLLGGAQIVAQTNRYVAQMRYPGVDIGVAAHDAIAL